MEQPLNYLFLNGLEKCPVENRFINHPEDGIEIQEDWFEYLQKHPIS